ncbi:GntR family transcriptional regulator [Vibrio algarum]|uniref:GntR family transcriptional regulator n=1 Tax=Vibrio algarum TaxID=3020714 RepID=A0ABT4YU38_9VIBR|nr:GntR family transcriptional regulator [Vibrio sp. KJ40-1]MDB1125089.1 GntR family transcriptional regulator [Vibrio sp. KJ40-1]
MTSTKQKTYEDLKYRIITQQLAPGDLLKDKEIMEQYGIGRTPLRDVFLELQSEGLINRVPRSGTWVAPMDFNFLKQITEVRIGIEGVAAELTASRITEKQLASLKSILEEVEHFEKGGQVNDRALIQLESEFHNIIYSSTGNPQLEKLLRSYQSLGARFWHYLVFSPEQMFEQFKSHHQLLEAIEKKDGSLSKTIAENHIRVYIDIIDRKLGVL